MAAARASPAAAQVHDLARAFAHDGAVEISRFFTESEFNRLRRHIDRKIARQLFRSMQGDTQVRGAPCEYGDPEVEQLLRAKASFVSDLLALDLIPAYSYLRLYRPGDRVAAHRDRPACEITIATSLAADPHWPLHILLDGRIADFCPARRGAVAFKGHDFLHWRSPLEGSEPMAHALFHYVQRHGGFHAWANDRRPWVTKPREKSEPCW
jgi:hypothetical protein